MIESIGIRGIGVIESAELPLGAGFTALTGETGAGKTMVITALSLLLGGRADSSVVRGGSGSALAEARWLVPRSGDVATQVEQSGGELEPVGEDDAELLVSRSVSAEGRNRVVVGGRTVPVGVLADLGGRLVAVHGQSEQLRLKSPSTQREMLDRFAGSAVRSVSERYTHAYRRWRVNRDELDAVVAERDARGREADELRVALAEIEGVAPQPGEDVALAAAVERLGNQDELRLAAAAAHEALSTDDVGGATDALGLLDAARRAVERAAPLDPALEPIVEQLTTLAALAVDAAAELAGYLDGLDPDAPGQLAFTQQRVNELAVLARKYGPSLDEVLEFTRTGSDRLLELDSDSERIDALAASDAEDERLVGELAAELSVARSAAAERLASAVTAELADLAMGSAQLMVDVASREEPGPTGRDVVQLLLQAYPGAEPRPVSRGASGGELSRVMLALEVVLAGSDPVPTFVFDEVDAGIGGAAAIEVGKRLARLAASSQVIAVTHLAQVAAFAGNHLRVTKTPDGEVTASTVARLTGIDRVAEMARLLSGLESSETALAHARELLALAGTA